MQVSFLPVSGWWKPLGSGRAGTIRPDAGHRLSRRRAAGTDSLRRRGNGGIRMPQGVRPRCVSPESPTGADSAAAEASALKPASNRATHRNAPEAPASRRPSHENRKKRSGGFSPCFGTGVEPVTPVSLHSALPIELTKWPPSMSSSESMFGTHPPDCRFRNDVRVPVNGEGAAGPDIVGWYGVITRSVPELDRKAMCSIKILLLYGLFGKRGKKKEGLSGEYIYK